MFTNLKTVSHDSIGVLVEPTGFCSGLKDYIKEKKGVRWQKNDDKWMIFVNWDMLEEFKKFIAEDSVKIVMQELEDLVLLKEQVKHPVNPEDNKNRQSKRVCVDYHGDEDGEIKCSINTRDNEPVSFLYKHIRLFHNIDTKRPGNKVYFSCTESSLSTIKALSKQPFVVRYLPFFSQDLKKRLMGDLKREVNEPETDLPPVEHFPLVDLKDLSLPFTPYPYQMEDATTLVSHDHMLIGHDMGAGKTLIATLVGSSIPYAKLVICPESLRLNWRKEILRTDKDAVIHMLYSDDNCMLLKDKKAWNIMGYHTMVKYRNEIVEAAIPVVFIDEAHNCKSVNMRGEPGSKRAEAALAIASKALYIYPMTGTPIPTSNKDLYNILKMLHVPKVTKSFYHYGQKFCNGHDNGFGWDISGNSHSDELHEVLAPFMVRRLKKDVLPDLKKQRIFIPMLANSQTVTKEEKELLNEIDEVDMDNFLGYAMKVRRLLSKIKIKPCIDLAENMVAAGKPVVIVSEFIETIDAIMDKFKDKACCIRGGMTDKKKQEAIEDFQSGKKLVCAVNMAAGGVGITLTKASDMIICDFDWTPANMVQVEDRICRAGQTQECTIYYLYAEDMLVDEIFVRTITSKNYNIDRVIDQAENSMDLKTTLKEESKSFFEIMKGEVRNALKERILKERSMA